MPAFDLNILVGQLILVAVFGAPIILVTASAAFITAFVPSGLNKWSRLIVAGALFAPIALTLETPWRALWVLEVGGMVIGLSLRATERYRLLWFPIAAVLALSIAVILFATEQYGMNNCYP
jgi:hypothetical protein